jgi:MFS family permease
LQAAIRILPSLIIGTILNVTTGFFVHKVGGFWLAVIPTMLSAIAPLLMAVSEPAKTYWSLHFVAQLFQPISSDILFTVGLIVITDVFPEEKHALAGAVFNTAAQFGNAFGLAIMQVVLTLVTDADIKEFGFGSMRAKLEGYRAGFWTMFGIMLICVVIGGIGFWGSGKIGLENTEEETEKEFEGTTRTEVQEQKD